MNKKKLLSSSRSPKSEAAFKNSSKILVGGVNSPVRAFKSVGGSPLFFQKGKKSYIWDLDGKRYLDYVGSWGPAILGHAYPATVLAVGKAIKNGFSFGAPHETETELAHLIRDAFPVMERVRLVNSGTEATLSAIRLARGYTGKDKILKFSGCYHGHGDSFLIKAGSGSLTLGLPDSPGVTSSIAGDTLTAEYNDISSVETVFEKHASELAAVIIEPVAGNMGLIPAEKDFLTKLREICKKNRTILIFDEVMTGLRLSWGGAQEIYRIKPDLVCLGKVVGGGFPVAAYGGPKEIMSHLAPEGPVYQAGTLSGHPVGMVAGVSVLNYLKKNNKKVYSELEKKGSRLEEGVLGIIQEKNYPVTMNRVGSMFTLFFRTGEVRDYNGAKASEVKHYARFFHALLQRGIYFPPSQFESGFISYRHDLKSIDETVKAIQQSLQEVLGG